MKARKLNILESKLKILVICAALICAWVPSSAFALTMEELIAALDEEQAVRLEDVAPEAIPLMLTIFPYALNIEDGKNRGRAIRRVFGFAESPETHSLEQLLKRFDRYGVTVPHGEVAVLYEFAVEMELEYARQIIETQASVELIEAETLRMRERNGQLEQDILIKQAELEAIRANTAQIEANTARLEANTARLEAEIVRLRALQVAVAETIAVLEAR